MNKYAQATWITEASCRKAVIEDPLLATAWDEPDNPLIREAKTICDSCPVRRECVVDALNDEEAYGMRASVFFKFGSLLAKDNRSIKKEFGYATRTRKRSPEDES